MTVINTTSSLRSSVTEAIHTLENLIHSDVTDARKDVENDVKEEVVEVVADVSPIIHKITIIPLTIGHSIEVQLQHAAGEVRRTIISGLTTADSLVLKLRDLVK